MFHCLVCATNNVGTLNLLNQVKCGSVIELSMKEEDTSTSPSNKDCGKGDGSVSRRAWAMAASSPTPSTWPRRCLGHTSRTSSWTMPPPWLLLSSPQISRIRLVPLHCKYYHFYWATKYNLQARENMYTSVVGRAEANSLGHPLFTSCSNQ